MSTADLSATGPSTAPEERFARSSTVRRSRAPTTASTWRSGGICTRDDHEPEGSIPACGRGDPVTEEVPGPRVTTDARLAAWIRREAWGHHASCTAAIGPADRKGSVLDGRLRVHGTADVRVVDASPFPRIPGLFITAPTLVLAEKASRDILRDAL
ncbi:GMC oxidoreductase [Streptomyces xanthophaeus]